MATQIEGIISKGQLLALKFVQDAVAASQTDAQLNICEVAAGATLAIDEYPMPWDGEIVGIAYTLSAAGTAGTFTIGGTVNGTEDADTTVSVGTTQRGTLRVPRGKATFVAGDRIGAEITTNGSWDAVTADLAVTVFVLVQMEGI
jgi:hypothetical protein